VALKEILRTRHDATLPSCCAPIHVLDAIHIPEDLGIVQCEGPGSGTLEVQLSPFPARQGHIPSPDLQWHMRMRVKTTMPPKDGLSDSNKRTDEFQLLELEREDRIDGLSDP
jgi:hypothetical protein